jgi:hypothetical protein
VSLLFPDVLTLQVSPHGVRASVCTGWRRRHTALPPVAVAVHAADNWQGLSHACVALALTGRYQQTHVVLSDGLVRYACAPWQAELRNQQEDCALAMLQFDDVYGAQASAGWHFAFTQDAPGAARLSVATPKAMLDLLRGRCGNTLPPLRSIGTAFTSALQSHTQRLADAAWLIHWESERVTFGSWNAGGWASVHSQQTRLPTAAALLAFIQRELGLAGVETTAAAPLCVYLHAPGLNGTAGMAASGLRLVHLATPLPRAATLPSAALATAAALPIGAAAPVAALPATAGHAA